MPSTFSQLPGGLGIAVNTALHPAEVLLFERSDAPGMAAVVTDRRLLLVKAGLVQRVESPDGPVTAFAWAEVERVEVIRAGLLRRLVVHPRTPRGTDKTNSVEFAFASTAQEVAGQVERQLTAYTAQADPRSPGTRGVYLGRTPVSPTPAPAAKPPSPSVPPGTPRTAASPVPPRPRRKVSAGRVALWVLGAWIALSVLGRLFGGSDPSSAESASPVAIASATDCLDREGYLGPFELPSGGRPACDAQLLRTLQENLPTDDLVRSAHTEAYFFPEENFGGAAEALAEQIKAQGWTVGEPQQGSENAANDTVVAMTRTRGDHDQLLALRMIEVDTGFYVFLSVIR